MNVIFVTSPSIVFSSLIAYLISQLNDIWIFHFLKNKTKGKYLWIRNNVSTWISQFIDSVIFSFFAFLILPYIFNTVSLPLSVVLQIAISTYIMKLIVAAIDTPFIYLSKTLK